MNIKDIKKEVKKKRLVIVLANIYSVFICCKCFVCADSHSPYSDSVNYFSDFIS